MESGSKQEKVDDAQETFKLQPNSELYPNISPPPYDELPLPPLPPQPIIPNAPPIERVLLEVIPVGKESATIVCAACQQEMSTRIRPVPTWRTHLAALIMCGIGCWPCACLPYFMDTCANVDHYCSNCNTYIGTYKS